ncbi:ribosomal protein S18 acetylase RimI-like enzyme [Primorskyibacter sedentarius]|uniref:Ribosomal protein S18 acetylase RimI-like enzyme n=1 Tax=Primorskyibacter sedentarius TaxID=745311 RepID=A0A4R3J7I8_9RHOB|nr:GNAT family N-acetyltransferase [Primorskyibacter sedentarius]TCS61889.1 ribosomal protein S18 acetylase RimI-like enzyme [Primorskyibacter sedentarius]
MTIEARSPRAATRADLLACAEIVAAWEAGNDWMTPGPDAGTLAGYLDAAFDAREIWVIGDPVVGYASVDPATGKLGAIYCAQTGQGLGLRLMDRAKEGRDMLWLTTHAPNTGAQGFYRREGFTQTATLPGEPPHDDIPLYRMEWRR